MYKDVIYTDVICTDVICTDVIHTQMLLHACTSTSVASEVEVQKSTIEQTTLYTKHDPIFTFGTNIHNSSVMLCNV